MTLPIDHREIDDILQKLDGLVKAKTENAVRNLHRDIEEAIKNAGAEISEKLRSISKASDDKRKG